MSFWWYWGVELLKLGKALAVAAALGLLLMGGFWALLAYYFYRPVKELSALRCPGCGSPFGIAAARAARTAYDDGCREAYREAEREHGAISIQFDTKWYVDCPNCQATACFDFVSHQLVDDPYSDESPDGGQGSTIP
jgi:hypothetical protein